MTCHCLTTSSNFKAFSWLQRKKFLVILFLPSFFKYYVKLLPNQKRCPSPKTDVHFLRLCGLKTEFDAAWFNFNIKWFINGFHFHLQLSDGPGEKKKSLRYIICCAMDPFATSMDFIDDFGRVIRNAILSSLGTVSKHFEKVFIDTPFFTRT